MSEWFTLSISIGELTSVLDSLVVGLQSLEKTLLKPPGMLQSKKFCQNSENQGLGSSLLGTFCSSSFRSKSSS